MAHLGTLLGYKVRFFFGPSLRGRFGPLPYLGLNALFLLYGYFFGFGLAQLLQDAAPGSAVDFLSTPLATFLALGLLYALGAGVTAHVSEFDFLMTAPVRPREYLAADLVFQMVSLLGAGGAAAVLAAFGIVGGLGRPLAIVVPFFLVFLGYLLLVLLSIQILVLLRARFPKAPVRSLTLVLFLVSLLPVLSLASPAFPIRFAGLPIPPSVFAGLGYAVLMGLPVDLGTVAAAILWVGGIASLWAVLSGTYLFHEIRPSLSAGFGQVDMIARMDQQRRIIGRLGRVTTRLSFRPDRGGDTSLMARVHLIRIVRDGSVFFVLLFALVVIVSVSSSGPGPSTGMEIGVTQLMTIIPATLAINWSYYERENLWIAVVSGAAPQAYFRGLFVAFTVLGLLVSGAFLSAYFVLASIPVSVESLALPIGGSVASALVATLLLTRLRIKPSAFSPAMLAMFFGVIVGGFVGGFLGQGLLVLMRVLVAVGQALQAFLLAAYVLALIAAGLWSVARLASSFRL